MTQTQFEQLYNARREQEIKVGFYKKTFPLMKSKVTKKAVYKDILSESGVPSRVLMVPPISKKVFDTNMFNVLCQEVWFYYIGTKLKRISSEGKYRPGVGFIKSENRGFADLHGNFNGRAVYIETKQVSENHLKSQKDFAEWVRSGGGIYVSTRSFEDIFEIVQCLINDEPLDKFMKIKQAKTRVDNRPLFELK